MSVGKSNSQSGHDFSHVHCRKMRQAKRCQRNCRHETQPLCRAFCSHGVFLDRHGGMRPTSRFVSREAARDGRAAQRQPGAAQRFFEDDIRLRVRTGLAQFCGVPGSENVTAQRRHFVPATEYALFSFFECRRSLGSRRLKCSGFGLQHLWFCYSSQLANGS